ncbi:hypothetical protein P171DRAFT_518627 [Karstenula rhodostoma CBS 690.94]|uniref:tRNA(Ile)-lysidine synthetase n=1 Tax=Karstenula rhodostoma CBS 690.94 TaxID=1392251 RepID=A0A9P4PQI9_9PLEO|nr:hypothetical protein P171DRAFT_518627 [Karstenula rhodostoma CBS 690.94]
MWKRNAACLRGCSSALAGHGRAWRADEPSRRVRDAIGSSYGILRRFAHTQDVPVKAEGAIGDDEFLEALRQVLPLEKLQPTSHAVGIAVSGGVDSMALATLYSKCKRSHQLPGLHGIIVDHKARPGSSEEAEWVAGQLSTLGVESTIIPIVWPEGLNLDTSTRFEAEARLRRYQALGKACKDNGIRSLLVAQHKDDQAETVLMRLCKKRHRSGLMAMRRIGWIPECYGVHGVHHSGSPASDKSPVSSYFEHGGTHVLRPLLDFEKSRLIATCEMHGTRWAEDETNQDRTLTTRNAVRHIFQNYKLPEALSRDSLVAATHKVRSRLEKHDAAAAALYSSCFFKLDIQTASLVIRFPPVEAFFANSNPLPSPSEKLQARATAQFLIAEVLKLVSPRERLVLETIANAICWIYPTLAPDGLPGPTTLRNANDCLFSQVQEETNDPTTKHLGPWLISRQPPARSQFEKIILQFPPKQTSDWQFFDGRYWVRVQNLTDRPIVMGFLTSAQLEKLMQVDPEGHLNPLDPDARTFDRRKQMRIALDTIQPHQLRRHLPALFLEPADPQQEPMLLALPTLQSNPDLNHDGQDHWECGWEIKYKKVEPGAGRSLSDVVRQPVWHPLEADALTLEQKAIKAQLDALLGTKPVEKKKLKVRKALKNVREEWEQGSKAKQPGQGQDGVVLTSDMRDLLQMSAEGGSIAWVQDVDLVREHDDNGKHIRWKKMTPVTKRN